MPKTPDTPELLDAGQRMLEELTAAAGSPGELGFDVTELANVVSVLASWSDHDAALLLLRCVGSDLLCERYPQLVRSALAGLEHMPQPFVIEGLREILVKRPERGQLIGPVVGRLQRTAKALAKAQTIRWTDLAGGRLAIGPRPRLRMFPVLKTAGCTHLVTLQSEKENARTIGAAARRAGIQWVWFPLETRAPPAGDMLAQIDSLYPRLETELNAGAALLVHCSAGIHRTGLIMLGLLRYLGLSSVEAESRLRSLRTVTAEETGDAAYGWSEQFARARVE